MAHSQDKRDISALLADHELITRTLQKAVREALKKHKQAGNPIVVEENGKLVWIPADEIIVDDDE